MKNKDRDLHIHILNPDCTTEDTGHSTGHCRCFICGEEVDFEIEEGFSLREAICPACGGSRRSSDLAKAVVETFCPDGATSLTEGLGCLEDLSIYEAQACGAIHQCLRGLPHYVCSEYLDDTSPGSTDEGDVRCEDMENLTFADNSFDLVITQDVFEHVKNPYKGFMEVRRVLKPGGVHIFTIPLHEGKDTVRRTTSEDREDIFHLPPVYHGDPLREKGSLVYTDFGEDITRRLKSLDFPTRIAVHNRFYSPDAIPHIRDGESYENYIYYRQRDEVLKYFLYNSVVFMSEKREDSGLDGLRWTGERYVPWVGGEAIHYEHLHRYRFAKEFVKGKKVLDLGCGEGYGSFMLSEDAGFVVGVDIDPECVRHASSKYSGGNLRFVEGSITDVPDGRDSYDVIVCFEVLEHIDGHNQLMDEVKRLLKPDGVFIVSTPDKRTYSDQPDYHNPFHVKELYPDEFRDLLSKRFGRVFLYGQRVEPGSRIFPLFECDIPERQFAIEETGDGFVFSSADDLTAKYFIAVASDNPAQDTRLVGDSRVVDMSDTVIRKMDRYVGELGDALRQKESVIQVQREEIEVRGTHIYNIESELNAIKQSRAWRTVEAIRRLVYDDILGKFPLVRRGVMSLRREGFSVFFIRAKKWLKNFL